jgi:hypothetical protein
MDEATLRMRITALQDTIYKMETTVRRLDDMIQRSKNDDTSEDYESLRHLQKTTVTELNKRKEQLSALKRRLESMQVCA